MSMERRSEAPDATIPSGCESLAHLTWHEDEATKIGPKVVKPQQMNSQFPATPGSFGASCALKKT